MSEEEGLLAAFTPEIDGVRKRVDGLLVAADERPAEVYSLQVVLFGLQVGDLADVVTVSRVGTESVSRIWEGGYLQRTLWRTADFAKCLQA